MKIKIVCLFSVICNILLISLILPKGVQPDLNIFTIPTDTILISEVRISEENASFDLSYCVNFDPQFYDALGSHIIDDELLNLYYLEYEVNVELFIDQNSISLPLNEVIHINEMMNENKISKQFRIDKNKLDEQTLGLLKNYIRDQRTDANFAHFSIMRTDEDSAFLNIIVSNEVD